MSWYLHIDMDAFFASVEQVLDPIYYLLFASKHLRGKDFWKKISFSAPSGQRSFSFDS